MNSNMHKNKHNAAKNQIKASHKGTPTHTLTGLRTFASINPTASVYPHYLNGLSNIMGVSLPHIMQVLWTRLWQEVIRKDVERYEAEMLGGSHTQKSYENNIRWLQ